MFKFMIEELGFMISEKVRKTSDLSAVEMTILKSHPLTAKVSLEGTAPSSLA